MATLVSWLVLFVCAAGVAACPLAFSGACTRALQGSTFTQLRGGPYTGIFSFQHGSVEGVDDHVLAARTELVEAFKIGAALGRRHTCVSEQQSSSHPESCTIQRSCRASLFRRCRIDHRSKTSATLAVA